MMRQRLRRESANEASADHAYDLELTRPYLQAPDALGYREPDHPRHAAAFPSAYTATPVATQCKV